MKIALAGARVRNNDIDFNLVQIRRYMAEAKAQGAELVCFGEAFLQGFDAYSWEYEKDRGIAVRVEDPVFLDLLEETKMQGIDLLFGFLEREGETLYSSCALMGDGKLIHLYRRVSQGWKKFWRTDDHYREGDKVEVFEYRSKKCLIALCGDLWDVTAPRFAQSAELLLWPLYITYSKEEWYGVSNERQAYANQALKACRDVLMINCVDDEPADDQPALGGCYRFNEGQVAAEWPLGSEGMLVVEVY